MVEYDDRDPVVIFAYDIKQLTAEELVRKYGITLEYAKIIKSIYEQKIKPREKQYSHIHVENQNKSARYIYRPFIYLIPREFRNQHNIICFLITILK